MDIYLVRHGESAYNVQDRMQGWVDVPLTDRGRQQAEALRTVLPAARVVTSDLSRAIETGAALRRLGEPRTDARLREVDVGLWQGMDKQETRRLPLWADYRERPATFRFPEGESLEQAADRMAAAFWDHAAGGGPLVLVSHSLSLRCLLCRLQGWSLDRVHDIVLPNASITRVVTDGRGSAVSIQPLPSVVPGSL